MCLPVDLACHRSGLTVSMPPKWSYSHHATKWSYSQHAAEAVLQLAFPQGGLTSSCHTHATTVVLVASHKSGLSMPPTKENILQTACHRGGLTVIMPHNGLTIRMPPKLAYSQHATEVVL